MELCAVRDCEKRPYANTVCQMHYWRIRRHGRIDNPAKTPEERFWEKVHRSETCWLWTGTRNHGGYGMFKLDGKNRLAHRVAYEWESGEIRKGLYLDHLCHVRRCVRPSHLEPVTPQVNAHRSDSPVAMNAAKTHCMRGHEFTKENTYTPPKANQRHCRTCRREFMSEARSEKPKRKANGNTDKTMCKYGHELSGYNLMISPNRRAKSGFQRRCRQCHNRLSAEGIARARQRKILDG
jgi:hypothetical protein